LFEKLSEFTKLFEWSDDLENVQQPARITTDDRLTQKQYTTSLYSVHQ